MTRQTNSISFIQYSSSQLFIWIGIFFTILAGTLLHFTFQWSGKSPFAAPISAVNESTWEHLKLLFYPAILFSIAEYLFYGHKVKNFILSRMLGILCGLASIIILFYTYTGVLGHHYLYADIAIFVIGTVLSFLTSNKASKKLENLHQSYNWIGIILLVLLLAVFILFTFYPPTIPLFLDPVSQTYSF